MTLRCALFNPRARTSVARCRVAEGTEVYYFCPCHNSAFTREGAISGPSPAARGLDTLAVEIRDEGEVWVKFQTFKARREGEAVRRMKALFDWLDTRHPATRGLWRAWRSTNTSPAGRAGVMCGGVL